MVTNLPLSVTSLLCSTVPLVTKKTVNDPCICMFEFSMSEMNIMVTQERCLSGVSQFIALYCGRDQTLFPPLLDWIRSVLWHACVVHREYTVIRS